jgi:hypothetical protein
MIANPITRPICRPICVAVSERYGTSTPSLPAGAIGVWYADQYQSTPRKYIPNEVTKLSVTPSANLLAGPRRVFNNNDIWGTFGTVTRADVDTTFSDASGDVSTINCTGNWGLRPPSAKTIPAGDYTIAVTAERNTGSDQQFCFSKDNTATRSSVKTATATVQRFTYTFNLAAPSTINLISLCSIDGVTAANLKIRDLELYSGSSDLGPQTYGGHMYLGDSTFDTVPTYATGELNLSTGGFGLVQMASTSTITQCTVVALASKTAAGSTHQSPLSKVTAFGEFTPMFEQSTLPQTYLKTSLQYDDGVGLWTLLSKGYHGFGHRYNGVSRDLFLDDVKMFTSTGTITSFTLRDMWAGVVNTISLSCGYKLSAVALYDRALTDAEYRTAYAVLKARAEASSLTVTPVAKVLIGEGDSITEASATRSYVARTGAVASPSVLGGVWAVTGSTIATMTTRATALDEALPPVASRTGRKFILSVMIGKNDIASLGTSAWLTALQTYLSARRAAGWTVVLCATLPSTAGGFNALRNTTNATISTWVGTYCDAYVSFAGSGMESDVDASDVGKYPDGTHPSAAGQILLEPYLTTAVNAL